MKFKNIFIKFIILSTVVIWILYLFLNAYHTNFIDGNQLSFLGAIIGGGLTLVGVWWTIYEQKKDLKEQQNKIERQRREDLKYTYKPLLKLNISVVPYLSNSLTQNNRFIIRLHETKNTKITAVVGSSLTTLKLTNIGRGEANNVNINITNLEITDNNRNPVNICDFEISIPNVNLVIGSNQYEDFVFTLTAPNDNLNAIKKIEEKEHWIMLTGYISYTDSFNNEYTQEIYIHADFKYDIKEKNISITIINARLDGPIETKL